jgi:hypothetical protein
MYAKVKDVAEDRKSFIDMFQSCHREWLAGRAYNKSDLNYYTTSLDAGPVKLPNEAALRTSKAFKVDKEGKEVDTIDTIDWARSIQGLVPDELLPNSQENVMRLFGANSGGITAPMAFLGACAHFFTCTLKNLA